MGLLQKKSIEIAGEKAHDSSCDLIIISRLWYPIDIIQFMESWLSGRLNCLEQFITRSEAKWP